MIDISTVLALSHKADNRQKTINDRQKTPPGSASPLYDMDRGQFTFATLVCWLPPDCRLVDHKALEGIPRKSHLNAF